MRNAEARESAAIWRQVARAKWPVDSTRLELGVLAAVQVSWKRRYMLLAQELTLHPRRSASFNLTRINRDYTFIAEVDGRDLDGMRRTFMMRMVLQGGGMGPEFSTRPSWAGPPAEWAPREIPLEVARPCPIYPFEGGHVETKSEMVHPKVASIRVYVVHRQRSAVATLLHLELDACGEFGKLDDFDPDSPTGLMWEAYAIFAHGQEYRDGKAFVRTSDGTAAGRWASVLLHDFEEVEDDGHHAELTMQGLVNEILLGPRMQWEPCTASICEDALA